MTALVCFVFAISYIYLLEKKCLPIRGMIEMYNNDIFYHISESFSCCFVQYGLPMPVSLLRADNNLPPWRPGLKEVQ